MRTLFLASMLAGCLALTDGKILYANAPPQPAAEKKQDAPKAEEKKFEPDRTSPVVHYLLAGIGMLIVMILVCMPAHRE